MDLGYWLSSEEHEPGELVELACRAEAAGFSSAMISDHIQPWTDTQGSAPFVWSVLGAIAARTDRIHLATGVTAAIRRMHPVVVAHAAATVAVLLEGRFALGLGTGERLNEQVVGRRWPRPGDRRRMLEEGLAIIKPLLAGEELNFEGRWFRAEHARLYSLPAVPPPIWVAVAGYRSAMVAGAQADGMIALAAQAALVEAFEGAGGEHKPKVAQIHVCWAEDETSARQVAKRWWPHDALPGTLSTELARPKDFQRAAALVSEDHIAATVVCGPDVDRHLEAISRYAGAGFDRVYVHQVGPDQAGFFDFYTTEVLPRFPNAAR